MRNYKKKDPPVIDRGVELFRESEESAQITLFKDYCSIDEKGLYQKINYHCNLVDYYLPKAECGRQYRFPIIDGNKTYHIFSKDLPNIEKRNKYFLISEFTNERVRLIERKFETHNERAIRRHLNNRFADIVISNTIRTITKKDDKLFIKVYYSTTHRHFNSRHFSKNAYSVTLSINLKTGNFNISRNRKLKRGQKSDSNCRTNHFNRLTSTSFLSEMLIYKFEYNSVETKVIPLYSNYFNYDNFISVLSKELQVDGTNKSFEKIIEEFFMRTKQIKGYDYDNLKILKYNYPTEKFLKKNKRKLIASALDKKGIKTDLTIKIVHLYDIDINILSHFLNLFGKNFSRFLPLINQEIFQKRDLKVESYFSGYYEKDLLDFINTISDDEKFNIVKIINSFTEQTSHFQGYSVRILTITNEIKDHLRMLFEIKKYYPEMKINAKTHNDFRNEHNTFGKIQLQIRNGYRIVYKCSDEIIKHLEEPIHNIKPFILKTSEDYYEEGTYMHHCVNSYVRQENSLIISLRDMNSKDRVTCEFNKNTGEIIQHRYFLNQAPPENFTKSIEILIERVLSNRPILKEIKMTKEKLDIELPEIKTTEPENRLLQMVDLDNIFN